MLHAGSRYADNISIHLAIVITLVDLVLILVFFSIAVVVVIFAVVT